jgi:hypothetical protein
VAVAEEEAGVDDSDGDWQSAASMAVVATGRVESGGNLKSFVMKNETTRSGLLFIGSKISATVLV